MSSIPLHPGDSASQQGDGSVAIVGMACAFPSARNVQEFWQNIVDGKDCAHDVDPMRWDPAVFLSDDPNRDDRVYCKRGGFLGTSFAFDPARYGAMPNAIPGAEPDQFLVLRTAYEFLV